jgi:hypothetical protein
MVVFLKRIKNQLKGEIVLNGWHLENQDLIQNPKITTICLGQN